MTEGRLVVGYHGCDATTRDDLVSGRIKHLKHSKNKYDWLGPGAYFFEADMQRALNFAATSYENPDKLYTSEPIGTPAVVGVLLSLRRVLDMTTQEGILEFEQACVGAESTFASSGRPVNAPSTFDDVEMLHRAYDNAVFSFLHEAVPDKYDAVRGAFLQGQRVGRSEFRAQTHIQLALKENACVLGWFLPPGAALLSPDEYAAALQQKAAIKILRTAAKPRRRVVAS